jgi:hypothetical protein
MQKVLIGVFGVLVVVLAVEIGVLLTTSHPNKKPVRPLSVTPTPKSKEVSLPLSSPDKDGAKVYVNKSDPVSKDYTTWYDGGFYYFRRKNSTKSVLPYLVRGTVVKAKDNEFEVEAQTADKTLYLVKIKLMPDVTVVKNGKNISVADIKVGNLAQFLPLRQSQKQGEYYLVRKVTVF